MAGINFIENEQYLPKLKFRNNMNSDRIKEIQESTPYPNSVSVQQALLKVWNECQQEHVKKIKESYDKGFEDGCRTAADDISSRI